MHTSMPRAGATLCPEGGEEMKTMWFKPGRARPKKRQNWVYYCLEHRVAVLYGVKWY